MDVLVLAVGLGVLGFGLLNEFRFDSFYLFDEFLIRFGLNELAGSEVDHFQVVVLVQQEVLRLEVSMDDAAAAQELQNQDDFSSQKFGLMDVEFFLVIRAYCGA